MFRHAPEEAAKPLAILIHGTGAATHSWRHLLPHLTDDFDVVTFDLPGHGFTQTPAARDLSIKGMARLIGALVNDLSLKPDLIIGHSAGAAIGAELCLSGLVVPRQLISINGAFKPFQGLAAKVFPVAAKLVALNPITIHSLAAGARDQSRVRAMLVSTGSTIDDDGLAQYATLFSASGHIAAVLEMMARWDLAELAARLDQLAVPLTLIVGANDKAVSPNEAEEIQKLLPQTQIITLPKLGHLAHEEDGLGVAQSIVSSWLRLKTS